jgi:hypothetical protein
MEGANGCGAEGIASSVGVLDTPNSRAYLYTIYPDLMHVYESQAIATYLR